MLTNWIRVIRKDDSVYTDYSLLNDNESTSITTDIVASEDAIYIGKVYPFNNFYIWIDTANALTSSMSISYWNGKQWTNAVDILDGTSSSGKTLAQSGLVQFSPKSSDRWSKVDDTSTVSANSPTDLNGFTIYGLYWLKITFTNDLTINSKIKRIFYLFTNQQTLEAIDSDVPNYLTSAFPTQNSFNRQLFTASKETLLYLKAKGILLNEGHILRIEDVYLSVAWRALSIIYFSLGKDYVDRRIEAIKMANESINIPKMTLDKNQDGFIQEQEIDSNSGGITRI